MQHLALSIKISNIQVSIKMIQELTDFSLVGKSKSFLTTITSKFEKIGKMKSSIGWLYNSSITLIRPSQAPISYNSHLKAYVVICITILVWLAWY